MNVAAEIVVSNTSSGQVSSQYVFVGGDVGFTDLADSDNVTALLATGNVGLYTQDGAVEAAYYSNTLAGVATGMINTGPGEAEVNLQSAQYATAWFQSWFQSAWLNYGMAVGEINSIINYDSSTWVTDFAATVAAAHSYGIATIAPIFSPNQGSYSLDSFTSDPTYAAIRSAALLGGGLCIDSPPAYFFQRGSAYQNFVYQEIQWAHTNNLKVNVIISPYGDDSNFLYDAKAFVKDLEWHNATPDNWVVENYTPNDPNGVGSDTDPNSIAGVALWVAQNAKTWSAVSSAAEPSPTLTVSQPGTVQEASVGAGVTVTETVSSTYLAGAVYVGVLTAAGRVESSYFVPVDLDDNGNATFTIHLDYSGDVVAVEDNLTNPDVFVKSAAVTITEPAATITLGALGTHQEATLGAGVSVTETIATSYINGPIYVGVVQANGNVESQSFSPVTLNANGTATFSAYLAHSGDYIVAETSLSNPALLVKSAAVTITEPAATITLGALGTHQEATLGAGVSVTETVATSYINGPIYVGVVQANGNVESQSFSPVTLNANGTATFSAYLAHSGDYIVAETSLSNPALLVKSAAVTITEPAATITLGALGTHQEATLGAGVSVTETIATSYINGPIYVGVVQANGNVESQSFSPVTLNANGTATFSAYLAHSGDYIVAETSLSNPALLVKSAAVTITEPAATITLGALGTHQEATLGAGVSVTETIATSYINGPIYVGVVQANGNVESQSFSPVTLNANGTATFSAYLAHSGDYIVAETSLSNPALLVKSAAVTITEPAATITLGALGTHQEATLGAGVSVTETVATSYINGPIYVGVVQANGNVESQSFSPVTLNANGTATFSAYLAHSGDYIVAETSLSNPALLVKSAAVTITEPAATITLGALGTHQEATLGAGVSVTETVATSYINGPIYVGVVQANGNVESQSFSPVTLNANGTATFSAYLAHSGDYIVAETSLSNPALLVKSAAVTITEPAATITLGALGTHQEATLGAGVSVTETIATSYINGPIYVGVVQANGNVESQSFSPVTLNANGTATFSAYLAHSGDYIVAETSLSNPALLVKSAAVTITEPAATITLGALGTHQEATLGAGVSVTETVATSYINGPIYVGVVQANGNVESQSFSPVTLNANGTATFSAYLAHSGDYIVAETSLSNPALLVKSAAVTITEPAATITLGALGTHQEATLGAGVSVTETVATSYINGPIYVGVVQANGNVESQSFSPVTLNANGTATFSAYLAHSGDYIVAETSLSNPALLVKSAAVTITEPAATITLGALGTHQEATLGAGVSVTETIATSYINGPIYVGVVQANGNVESQSFSPVTLNANGTATFSAYLAHSGDYIVAETSLSNPALLVKSAAVTITEPAATITLGALGTHQEATLGAGVSVTETVATSYINGPIYVGVVQANGNVESQSFSPVTLNANGTATFSAYLAHSGDYIVAETSLSNPALLVKSAAVTITEAALSSSSGSSQPPTDTVSALQQSSAALQPVFISGNENVLTLSSNETLYDSGSNNTLVFPTQGAVTLSGNVISNGDTFDLRSVMASTAWNGQQGDLSNYLTSVTANGGNDTEILLHKGGGSSSTILATLLGDGAQANAFTLFEQHSIFI